MSVVDEIRAELLSAEVAAQLVARVRVTPYAIPGSAVVVHMLRHAVELADLFPGVIASETWLPTEWYELLVHPEDWTDVLMDVERSTGLLRTGRVDYFLGLDVAYD